MTGQSTRVAATKLTLPIRKWHQRVVLANQVSHGSGRPRATHETCFCDVAREGSRRTQMERPFS